MSLVLTSRVVKYDPTLTSAQCRIYSSFLSQYPWQSREMQDRTRVIIDDVNAAPNFTTFFSSLYEFENAMFTFRPSTYFDELRNILGFSIVPNYDDTEEIYLLQAHQNVLPAAAYQKACSVLCAYRLHELILLRSGVYTRLASSVMNPIMYLPPSKPSASDLVDYDKLHDWPVIVSKFIHVVRRSNLAPLQAPSPLHPLASLLHMLSQNHQKLNICAIQENFLLASIAIAAMTSMPFSDSILPDLPLSVPTLQIPPGSFTDQASYDAFQQQYNMLIGSKTSGNASGYSGNAPTSCRVPFQLAVLISPLYLLLPRRLSSKSFHRRSVIEVAAKLGPTKPESIIAVENAIWDTVFLLASGKILIDAVLIDLANRLAHITSESSNISQNDRCWFDLTGHSSMSHVETVPSQKETPGSQFNLQTSTFPVAENPIQLPGSSYFSSDASETIRTSENEVDTSNSNSCATFTSSVSNIEQPSAVPALPLKMTVSGAAPSFLSMSAVQETYRISSQKTSPNPAIHLEKPVVELDTSNQSPHHVQIDEEPLTDVRLSQPPSSHGPPLPSLLETSFPESESLNDVSKVDISAFRDRHGAYHFPSSQKGSLSTSSSRSSSPKSNRDVADELDVQMHEDVPLHDSELTVDGPHIPLIDLDSSSSGYMTTMDHDSYNATAKGLITYGRANPDHSFSVDSSTTYNDTHYIEDRHQLRYNRDFVEREITLPHLWTDVPFNNSYDHIRLPSVSLDSCSSSTRIEDATPAPTVDPQLLTNGNKRKSNRKSSHTIDNEFANSLAKVLSLAACQNNDDAEGDIDDSALNFGGSHATTGAGDGETPFPEQACLSEGIVTPPAVPTEQAPVNASDHQTDIFNLIFEPSLMSSSAVDVGSPLTSITSSSDTESETDGSGDAMDVDLVATTPPVSMLHQQQKNSKAEQHTDDLSSLGPGFPNSLLNLGTSQNPIDVDEIFSIFEPVSSRTHLPEENISIPSTFVPPRRGQHQYTFYDGNGVPVICDPYFHFDCYHERFHQFVQRGEELYVDGLPLHITSPSESIIKVLSYEEWTALTSEEQQALCVKNVVVRNWELKERLIFDIKGITQVAGVFSRQISINDYSIDPGEGCGPTTVSGRLADIWNNREPGSKILNALDLPCLGSMTDPQSHTTDIYSWLLTAGHHGVDHAAPYPMGMQWSLIGLRHSLTFLHIDCDGLSTDITILDGGKIWGFLRERPSNPISSINFFLQNDFRLNEVLQTSDYDFEIIALRPGDKLFMRPCQPHFVYGYEHTICRGSHSYFSGNLQLTFQGIIHAFVLHQFLTNTAHPTHAILRRMVILFHMSLLENEIPSSHAAASHIPNVNSMNGVIDLLCACILVLFGNVLDFRTYRAPNQETSYENKVEQALKLYDINAIPFYERADICYARGVALHLIAWIRQCAIIKNTSNEVISDLPSLFVVQIASTLVNYKARANVAMLEDESDISLHELRRQIHNIINIDAGFTLAWKNNPNNPPNSLVPSHWNKYSVQWITGAHFTASGPFPTKYFVNLGMTDFDRSYFNFQKERQQYEVNDVIPRLMNLNLGSGHNSKKRKVA